MQNQSCFGGRLIVAPLVHLLLISSTPMHLKLINNPLCYLTDQIIIREVQLKSCHTLIKKCSFNFFEQCIYFVFFLNLKVFSRASAETDGAWCSLWPMTHTQMYWLQQGYWKDVRLNRGGVSPEAGLCSFINTYHLSVGLVCTKCGEVC